MACPINRTKVELKHNGSTHRFESLDYQSYQSGIETGLRTNGLEKRSGTINRTKVELKPAH